jgi:hypothetical protein
VGKKPHLAAWVMGISNMHGTFFVRNYRRIVVGVTAAFVFVLVPAAALAAGSPTDAQYTPVLQQVSVGGGPPPSSAGGSGGGLPFTGLDVALLAAIAGGLLLAGLLLRRHRPTTEI